MPEPALEEEIALARLDDPNVQAEYHVEVADIALLNWETATGLLPGKRVSASLPWQRINLTLRKIVHWQKGGIVNVTHPRHGLAEGRNMVLAGSSVVAGQTNLSLIVPRYWTDEKGKSTGRRLTVQHLERMRRAEEPFGPNAGKKKPNA
jgi:hypothetical protein